MVNLKINPLKSKQKNSIEKVIEEVIKQKNKSLRKTFSLVCFHKKDKNVVYLCSELDGEAVKIGKTYYYADSKRIYETIVQKGKTTYRIPQLDIYEGITVAYTPYEDIDTRKFSEVFQDIISLHIERGILENKRKKQVNLRNAITIGLIAIAGIVIFGRMIFGG